MMQKALLAMLLASLSGMSHAACGSSITPRYQLLNNATEVKDLKTNLIWQRCNVGQTWVGSCTGKATTYTWSDALKVGQNIEGGWRLPNVKELFSLVEESCDSPNQTFFPDAVYSMWSSSPVANDSSKAWVVRYSGSDSKSKSDSYYVRLVRTGQ